MILQVGMILTVTESTWVQVGLRTEQNARRRQMQQAMRSTGFGGGLVIGKLVGAPWDGTLNNQPDIHHVYWVFVGYISPFKGSLGG